MLHVLLVRHRVGEGLYSEGFYIKDFLLCFCK